MPVKSAPAEKSPTTHYFYHDGGLKDFVHYTASGEKIEFSPYIAYDYERGKVTYMFTTAVVGSERYNELKRISGKLGIIETDSPLIFAEKIQAPSEPKRVISKTVNKDGVDEVSVKTTSEEAKQSLSEYDIKDLLLEDDK